MADDLGLTVPSTDPADENPFDALNDADSPQYVEPVAQARQPTYGETIGRNWEEGKQGLKDAALGYIDQKTITGGIDATPEQRDMARRRLEEREAVDKSTFDSGNIPQKIVGGATYLASNIIHNPENLIAATRIKAAATAGYNALLSGTALGKSMAAGMFGSATEVGLINGAIDATTQALDVYGSKIQDEYSLARTGISTLVGMGFGGAMHGAGAVVSKWLEARKLGKVTDDSLRIYREGLAQIADPRLPEGAPFLAEPPRANGELPTKTPDQAASETNAMPGSVDKPGTPAELATTALADAKPGAIEGSISEGAAADLVPPGAKPGDTAPLQDADLVAHDGDLSVARDAVEPEHFTVKVGDQEIGRIDAGGGYVQSARIADEFQRQGYGSRAYDLIEKMTGETLHPSPVEMSPAAQAFWQKRLANMDPAKRAQIEATVAQHQILSPEERTLADQVGGHGTADAIEHVLGGPEAAPAPVAAREPIKPPESLEELKSAVDAKAITKPEILQSPVMHDALDRMAAIPETDKVPGYNTAAHWAGREFVIDGQKVVGKDAAIDALTRKAASYAGEGGPRAEKQAYIVVGPSAAGKSTAAEALAKKAGAAIPDADDAKAVLPEFQGGIGASAVHEESSVLANETVAKLVERGTNVVLPKVGGSAKSIERAASELKAEGYAVHLINVDVHPDEAFNRMIQRFIRTGRLINPEYFDAIGNNPSRTFITLRDSGIFDSHAEIDANGPFGTAYVRSYSKNPDGSIGPAGAALSELSGGRWDESNLGARRPVESATPGQNGQVVPDGLLRDPNAQPAGTPGLVAKGEREADAVKKQWRAETPHKDLNTFLQSSVMNQVELASRLRLIVADLGQLPLKDPGIKTLPLDVIESLEGPKQTAEQLKFARFSRKIEDDSGAVVKDPGTVTDQVRGGVTVFHPSEAEAVLAKLAEHFELIDEGWQFTPVGYFDRKAYVRFSDGMIGEVQIYEPSLLEAKTKLGGHKLYQQSDKAMKAGDGELVADLTAKMKALYEPLVEDLSDEWKASLGRSGKEPNRSRNLPMSETDISNSSSDLPGRQDPSLNTQASRSDAITGSPSNEPKRSSANGTSLFPDELIPSHDNAPASESVAVNEPTAEHQQIAEQATARGVTPAVADAVARQDGNYIGKVVPSMAPHEVVDAANHKVTVVPVLVELRDLITSDKPDFDQALQPRDRKNRVQSDEQVREIVTKFDPQRLGVSTESDRGSPIVGPDRMVESGNGRIMALSQIYDRYPDKVEAYKAWMASQGIDASGFDQPVLVRQNITPLGPDSRASFALNSNKEIGMGMGGKEVALGDHTLISSELLAEIHNTNNLGAVANQGFFSKFLAKLNLAERARLQDADGNLNAAGMLRARNALVAAAYGDHPVLARITDTLKDEVRSISSALVAAAPDFAKLKIDIAEGRVPAALDRTGPMLHAVEKVAELREKGTKFDAYLKQGDMLKGEAEHEVDDWMRLFYNQEGKRALGAEHIVNGLREYVRAARDVPAAELPGFNLEPVSPKQLMRRALEEAHASSNEAKAQGSLGLSLRREVGDVASDGAGRQATPGSEPGGARGGTEGAGLRRAEGGEAGGRPDAQLKTWFGASKIVDEQGAPLVVYHGTLDDGIASFQEGSHFGTAAQAGERLKQSESVNAYRAEKGLPPERVGAANVHPVYLKIENPKRVEDAGGHAEGWTKAIAEAKAEGHDGLVYQNWGEFDPDASGNPRDSYVVFSPDQVRSAFAASRETPGAPQAMATRTAPRARAADPTVRFIDRRELAGEKDVRPSLPIDATPEEIRNFKVGEEMRQIASDLGRKLEVDGRFTMRGVEGEYKPKQGVLRIRWYGDMQVFAHELGHAIDQRLDLNPLTAAAWTQAKRQNSAELRKLDPNTLDPTKQKVSEGVAEVMRNLIEAPEWAEKNAPQFTAAFKQILDQDPDLAKALERARRTAEIDNGLSPMQAMEAQIAAPPPTTWTDKLRQRIRKDGIAAGIGDLTDSVYAGVVAQDHWVGKVVKQLRDAHFEATGQALPETGWKDPYQLYRMLPGAAQGGVDAVLNGVRPYGGHMMQGPVVEGLHVHLSNAMDGAIGRLMKEGDPLARAFDAYLMARRAVGLWDRKAAGDLKKQPIGATRDQTTASIAEFEAKYPQFKAAADGVFAFTNAYLDKKFDAGLIPRDVYEAIKAQGGDYAPFRRDMTDLKAGGGGVSTRNGVADNGLRKLMGSTRPIVSPIHSILEDVAQTERMIAQNDFWKSLHQLAQSGGPFAGRYIERIPNTELKGVSVDLVEALRNAARREGVDKAETEALIRSMEELVGSDMTATTFRSTEISPKGERIVFYWDGGERVALKLGDGDGTRQLFDLVAALNTPERDFYMATIGRANAFFSAMVTTAPEFALKNLIMDNISRIFIARNTGLMGRVPGAAIVAGIHASIFDKEFAKAYAAFGGIRGGQVSQAARVWDRNAGREMALEPRGLKERMAELRHEMSTIGGAAKTIIYTPVRALESMIKTIEYTETAGRLGQAKIVYKYLKGRGFSDDEALRAAFYEGRDILDYDRRGGNIGAMVKTVPFLNAGLQGTDRALRNLLGAPLQAFREKAARGGSWDNVDAASKSAAKDALHNWAVIAAGIGLTAGYTFHMAGDPKYQKETDYMRRRYFIFHVGDHKITVPKPFDLPGALMSTVEGYIYGMINGDSGTFQTAFKNMADGFVPRQFMSFEDFMSSQPLAKVAYEHYAGQKLGFEGRNPTPIVPQGLKALPPDMQYDAYSSWFSKKIGSVFNVSPKNVEHVMDGLGATMSRDANAVLTAAFDKNPNMTMRDAMEKFFLGGLYRQDVGGGQPRADVMQLMARDNGTYAQLSNGYRHAREVGDQQQMDSLFNRGNDTAKTLMILGSDAAFKPNIRGLHPLVRSEKIGEAVSSMLRDLAGSEVNVEDRSRKRGQEREKIPLEQSTARAIMQTLTGYMAEEMRNGLTVAGEPGYQYYKTIDTQPRIDAIRALSPEVADELEARLEKRYVLPIDRLEAEWPNVKQTILQDREAGARSLLRTYKELSK